MTISAATLARLALRLAGVGVLALTACSTSPPADGGDWARTFAYPLEEVYTAALLALEHRGLVVVESDRERGRIQAEADPAGLELRLRSRGDLVTVQVLGMGSMGRPVRTDRLETEVTGVLEEIARILRGR